MKRIVVYGVAGAVLVGGLTACKATVGRSEQQASPTGTRAEASGAQAAADKAAAAGIDWADCPKDWGFKAPVQCGYVTVPLDYAKPNDRKIRIAVNRVQNTGTRTERQGALLVNPGGPGGSGLALAAGFNHLPGFKNVAKAYDIIGFDPRGVGQSAPISCMDPQEFVKSPKEDPVPGSEADKRYFLERVRAYAKGCEQRSGDLLPYITTPNTVRDMDVIRAALGEKKLNFWGASYGTYLGAVYTTLFPGRVRRMIFDSAVDPSQKMIWYRSTSDEAGPYQKRWGDFTRWVAKYDAVYHIGNTPAKVEKAWAKLRSTAKAHAIGGKVGPYELLDHLADTLGNDRLWPHTAQAWSNYLAGNPQSLIEVVTAKYMRSVQAENSKAVWTTVACNDAKWPEWKTWDRDYSQLHKSYPLMSWYSAWTNLPCATWSRPQHDPVEVKTPTNLPRILIVQSERDPVTPYPWAVSLHKRMTGSLLITEKGAGNHGVSAFKNPCVNDRVDVYLLQGKLDAGDVICAGHRLPVPPSAAKKKPQRTDRDRREGTSDGDRPMAPVPGATGGAEG